jgi:hypothetical protein
MESSLTFLDYLYPDGNQYYEEYVPSSVTQSFGLKVRVRTEPTEDVWDVPIKLPVTERHLIPFVEVADLSYEWRNGPPAWRTDGKISVVSIETFEVLHACDGGYTPSEELKLWIEKNRELLLDIWNGVCHFDDNGQWVNLITCLKPI